MNHIQIIDTDQSINQEYLKQVLVARNYKIIKEDESRLTIFKRINHNFAIEKTHLFKESAIFYKLWNILSGKHTIGSLTSIVNISNSQAFITLKATIGFYLTAFFFCLIGIVFIILPSTFILYSIINSVLSSFTDITLILMIFFLLLFLTGSVFYTLYLITNMKKSLFKYAFTDIESLIKRRKLNKCINCGKVNIPEQYIQCPDCGDLL